MSRRYLWGTLVATSLASCSLAGTALFVPHPKLIWNASASAPIGHYSVYERAPERGDLVAIVPPVRTAKLMAERHYLPLGVPLLKYVAAMPGQQVCRQSTDIMLDGRNVAIAKLRDKAGRPLPVWQGCRKIRRGEVFLLNPAPDSFDGRYLGPLPTSGLIGVTRPVFTRDAPNHPLRWRLDSKTQLPSPSTKEKLP